MTRSPRRLRPLPVRRCLACAVVLALGAGATATFSAFLRSNGTAIPFNPATTRLFANFYQVSLPVGSTSIAVRTVAAPDANGPEVSASAD